MNVILDIRFEFYINSLNPSRHLLHSGPNPLPPHITYDLVSLEIRLQIGDDAVLPRQSHEAVVALAHPANLAAQGVNLIGAGHSTRLFVQFGDINLI